MAEERIIDDEYGRGVKLRKTKEGYVDVTDEMVEGGQADETAEEVSFSFPIMDTDEDDEDLVGLSPEEAAALRKKKAEAAQKRREEYEQTVAKGEVLLGEKNFEEAEQVFEQALGLDEIATEASVGYWRAKTEDFAKPEVLIEEYVEPGIESLEFDLGYEAAEIIKKKYRSVFQAQYDALEEEEIPLAREVEEKQTRRRTHLKERRKKSVIAFALTAIPMILFAVLTAVFTLKITSTPDNRHLPYAIGFGVATAIFFVVFAIFTNKMINVFRIYSKNEKLTATEEGERLFEIRERKDLYGALLKEETEALDEN